jgi:hypothetical protein
LPKRVIAAPAIEDRRGHDRLWADLVAQADALRDGTASPGHFIGSLVLAPAPTTIAGGVQRWLVVDGQQRLTTLLLALAALRDHVGRSGVRCCGIRGSTSRGR